MGLTLTRRGVGGGGSRLTPGRGLCRLRIPWRVGYWIRGLGHAHLLFQRGDRRADLGHHEVGLCEDARGLCDEYLDLGGKCRDLLFEVVVLSRKREESGSRGPVARHVKA